jgi:hypothetical protein
MAMVVSLVLLGVVLGATPQGTTPPADKDKVFPRQVLIIRHAEKPDEADNVNLTEQGKERAKLLPQLFQRSDTRPMPFDKPDFLFATKNSQKSHRPLQTITPLAEALKLPINADFPNADHAKLAEHLLSSPKYAGKVVLISWHHGTTPDLAKELRASVPEKYIPWPKETFDRVWQITYDEKGKTTFSNRPQQLLPTDSKE